MPARLLIVLSATSLLISCATTPSLIERKVSDPCSAESITFESAAANCRVEHRGPPPDIKALHVELQETPTEVAPGEAIEVLLSMVNISGGHLPLSYSPRRDPELEILQGDERVHERIVNPMSGGLGSSNSGKPIQILLPPDGRLQSALHIKAETILLEWQSVDEEQDPNWLHLVEVGREALAPGDYTLRVLLPWSAGIEATPWVRRSIDYDLRVR